MKAAAAEITNRDLEGSRNPFASSLNGSGIARASRRRVKERKKGRKDGDCDTIRRSNTVQFKGEREPTSTQNDRSRRTLFTPGQDSRAASYSATRARPEARQITETGN